ncbi:MAG TPA: VacB/RNase II family 3'-5' exoribonuclease [Candidatus Kapabacteria bacterium]|nr:VacB/RNase II family 3'-5' exoribonuclease [Candidatus Kapabacteria bacterium]
MSKKKHSKDFAASRGTLTDELLRLFTNHTGELFKTNEISKMIGIRSDDDRYQELRTTLRQLEEGGVITRSSRRRFGIPLTLPDKVNGVLKIERNGRGIVKPDPGSGMNIQILIHKNHLGEAHSGDKVVVKIHADSSTERVSGEILDVLERREQTYPKSQSRGGTKGIDQAVWSERRAAKAHKSALPEQLPERKIFAPRERKEPTFKEEIEHLEAEYGLPGEFPEDVIAETRRYPEHIPSEEIAKRHDLRKETIFTIDPEDAKDFDDAISLTENDDWTVTLGVHIADVSYFVRESTMLDAEALERGTSVYLAGGVIPMLPEELSNELCSLKPGVERLTFSVFMKIDPLTGKVKQSDFRKSIIKSVMRFTYEEAEKRTTTGKGKYSKLLRSMRELSEVMYAQRRKAGSIDFETEEVRFKFDENREPIEALKKQRLGSMRMIEEFMLAANRAVAEFIALKAREGNEKPFLYRIHADPDPEKIRDIASLAKSLGYSFNPEHISPKSIQKFLDSIKDKPEEHLLNGLMLRAMAKAVYAEHNVGHFGLAFMHYTHFTSPIRRYPDLIIHRMLDEYLSQMSARREHHYFQLLPDIADHTSAMERRATEAERDSAKVAGLFVMRSQVGNEFEGTITGVQHYGFFVGLDNGAEGLLHIRELKGFYIYDEAQMALVPQKGLNKLLPHQRRGKARSTAVYRIGEKVRVKLLRVNFEKRGLDFILADEQ